MNLPFSFWDNKIVTIPTMISNNLPYGIAYGSSFFNNTFNYYKAYINGSTSCLFNSIWNFSDKLTDVAKNC